MADDDAVVTIPAQRLLRLRTAVTLASEGGFHDAIELLDDPQGDDFSEIEQLLRAFIREFKIAIEQSDIAIEEFRVSKRELEQKLEMIEQQRAAIRELSSPIIDVWDDVITVPLTGLLDSIQAQDLTERLLARVHASHTAWVILDLTGIDIVDAQIASHLIKLAGAVRLMGAECLVTGIGPRVANAFVTHGSALGGLRSMASLREGLKFCLLRRR